VLRMLTPKKFYTYVIYLCLKYQLNPSTIVQFPAFLVMLDHRALEPRLMYMTYSYYLFIISQSLEIEAKLLAIHYIISKNHGSVILQATLEE